MPALHSVIVRSLSILAFNLLPGLTLAEPSPAERNRRLRANLNRIHWSDRSGPLAQANIENKDGSGISLVQER